jgi:hypothetical protein
MMRKKTVSKLFGAGLVGAAMLAPAHADVITFEGNSGLTGHTDGIQEKGYNVGFYSNAPGAMPGDLVGSFVDGSDPGTCVGGRCPINNPSTYFGALNDGYVDIKSTAPGGAFSIKSFDASFIGGFAALSSYPAVAGLLRIQGWLADGSSATETYELAGPSAAGFNFAHYNTTDAFGNLQFVDVALFGYVCDAQGSCSAFSSDQGQFGIDNIALSDFSQVPGGEVPEPSTCLTLGLGMLGLLAARRRKA